MRNEKGYNEKEVGSKKKYKKKIITSFCLLSFGVIAVITSSFGMFGNTIKNVSSNSEFSSVVDFDSSSIEYKYSYDKIKTDFHDINFVKGIDRLYVKEDALWINYPMNSSGADSSGAMINTKLDGSDEYTLEYEVYFDGCGTNFNWQDGGVLSGLAGGEFYDGSKIEARKEGFHAMLTYNNYGYVYPLVYSSSDENVDGTLFQNIGQINEYTWNKIKMYVKINDKGKDNGIFRVWLNDNLCFNNETITYTNCGQKIDTNNLCAYNNESSKVLANEQFVYIDNYHIYDQNE